VTTAYTIRGAAVLAVVVVLSANTAMAAFRNSIEL